MNLHRKQIDWRIKLAFYVALGVAAVVAMVSVTWGECVWSGDHWECTGGSGAWQPSTPAGARQILDVPGPMTGGAISASPHPARCRVVMENGDAGSGTLLSRTLVITANHVVKDSRGSATVRFPDGTVAHGGVVAVDPVYDLAAISLDSSPAIEPMQVDDTDQSSGELVAGGFGGDGVFRAVRGPITGWVQYDGNVQLTPCPKIAGAVRPGDSGGAVVNQSRAFVGVVWGCRDGETYLTCGRPLRTFLDRVLPNRSGRIIARNDQLVSPPVRQSPLPSPEPDSPPISSTPEPAAGPEPTVDWTARLDAIDERLAALDAGKQQRGEYLQPGDLNGYATIADIPKPPDLSGLVTSGDLAAKISGLQAFFDAQLAGASKTALAKILAGALGVSTPIGLAIVLAGSLAGRRARQVIHDRIDRGEGGPRSETFRRGEQAASCERSKHVPREYSTD